MSNMTQLVYNTFLHMFRLFTEKGDISKYGTLHLFQMQQMLLRVFLIGRHPHLDCWAALAGGWKRFYLGCLFDAESVLIIQLSEVNACFAFRSLSQSTG